MVRSGIASHQGRTGHWQRRGICGWQAVFSQLELSAGQASLSWALRAATSLAIAEKSVGRKEAAWRTLQATHAKFREGLETPDLRLARQVLNGSYRRETVIDSMH